MSRSAFSVKTTAQVAELAQHRVNSVSLSEQFFGQCAAARNEENTVSWDSMQL